MLILRWLNGAVSLDQLLRWPAEYVTVARDMMLEEARPKRPDTSPASKLKGPGRRMRATAEEPSAGPQQGQPAFDAAGRPDGAPERSRATLRTRRPSP